MDQYNNQPIEREFGWEDEIVNDGQEFIDIPDGDYDFLVETVDRGRFNGSAKMPACNQANITLVVEVPGIGPASIKTSLMLHSKVEWKLSEFFASIGLKQKDQPLRMRWNIQGAKGKCKIGHREYQGNRYNEVKKFYPIWEINKQPQQAQPNYGYNNNNQGGFTPGRF